mmetsp:Transcript_40719/g.77747  ORF Transcript_40719/g.77747 Transcript_40719/m.77747 type:complete len:124 (-) Transcript_40719:92-463(-)
MSAVAFSSVVGIPALATRAVTKKSATQKIAAAPLRVAAKRSAVVVCKASVEHKTIAAASSAAAVFAANPAFALVDSRLNGDGVGLPLGVSDPILFWILAGMFTTIWALFYTSTKDGDDSGLSL